MSPAAAFINAFRPQPPGGRRSSPAGRRLESRHDQAVRRLPRGRRGATQAAASACARCVRHMHCVPRSARVGVPVSATGRGRPRLRQVPPGHRRCARAAACASASRGVVPDLPRRARRRPAVAVTRTKQQPLPRVSRQRARGSDSRRRQPALRASPGRHRRPPRRGRFTNSVGRDACFGPSDDRASRRRAPGPEPQRPDAGLRELPQPARNGRREVAALRRDRRQFAVHPLPPHVTPLSREP